MRSNSIDKLELGDRAHNLYNPMSYRPQFWKDNTNYIESLPMSYRLYPCNQYGMSISMTIKLTLSSGKITQTEGEETRKERLIYLYECHMSKCPSAMIIT